MDVHDFNRFTVIFVLSKQEIADYDKKPTPIRNLPAMIKLFGQVISFRTVRGQRIPPSHHQKTRA